MNSIKTTTADLLKMLDKEQTRSNKELLIAAGICTAVGIGIGYIIGRVTTNKKTLKKFNKCYTYDFGKDENVTED